MAARDLDRAPTGIRARLGELVGSGEGYAAFVRRQKLRQWSVIAAVLAGLVAIAVVGYAIGSSQAGDAAAARQAGAAAGAQRGAAAGARDGYAGAFRAARERAYDAAYREAYVAAYRDTFERADLPAPETVPVSGSGP